MREILQVSPSPYFYRGINIIICLFFAAGCITNIPLSQRETLNHGKRAFIIDNVPYIRQKSDYCGPAALAMLFNFWGIHSTQDDVAQEVFSPELKGTLSIKMVLYAIRKGFEAEMYNSNLPDIKDKIEAGFPLIVSYRTHKGQYRVHYMVIKGFDDSTGVVYAHSGEKENQRIGYKSFLKHWGWADNLTFFIHPKDKVNNN